MRLSRAADESCDRSHSHSFTVPLAWTSRARPPLGSGAPKDAGRKSFERCGMVRRALAIPRGDRT